MPFPFLRLPSLIQDNVLRLTEDFDRIVFSLVSNKSKNLVKHANSSLRIMEWGLFDKPNLSYLEFTNRHIGFSIEELSAGERENGQRTQLVMNGNVYPALRTPTGIYMEDFARPFRHPWKIMEEMTKHVLEMSRCDQFVLKARTDSEDLFVFNYTRRFNSLLYNRETWDRRSSARLSDFLLRDLEITGKLCFYLFPEEGYTYSGPLRMGILEPVDGGFLAEDSILIMECREAFLNGRWSNEKLNRFIKKWLSGGLQNLEKCIFIINPVFNENTIFEGIQTIPFSLNNRPRRHTGDQPEGLDIRRSDGCLATIDIVTLEVDYIELTFYVWKELM